MRTKGMERADRDAIRQLRDDAYVILCEAGTALHRMGWGSSKIDNYMSVLQDVEDEISADNSKSAIQLLEEETGIELKVTADGKSWRELAYLNSNLEMEFKSEAQYIYMRKRQMEWDKTCFIAVVFIGLHRKEGWGATRLQRLLDLMHQISEECKGKMKRIVKLYNAETGNILHIGYAEDE